jgi:hypothetical protein
MRGLVNLQNLNSSYIPVPPYTKTIPFSNLKTISCWISWPFVKLDFLSKQMFRSHIAN